MHASTHHPRIVSIITVVMCALATFPLHAAIEPARVDLALKRAKDYLYAKQTGDNWERMEEKYAELRTADTALAVFALLSAGQSHQDPRIEKAIAYLKKTPAPGPFALGARCHVWMMLPDKPDVKQALARDAKALRDQLIKDGKGKGFYDKDPGSHYAKHRDTQFGVLGTWAAAQAGHEIPNAYWQIVEKAWMDSQDASGGWRLDEKNPTAPITPGLTAIGAATLFITQDFLRANESVGCRGNIKNPHIEHTMKFLSGQFDQIAKGERYEREFPYSTSFALERIGYVSGLKYFNGIDWYERVGTWILERQRSDGGWPAEYGNVASTSFAMLFLARGRAPVAFNKLDYTLATVPSGAGAASAAQATKSPPWNQRPHDVANVSQWIGRQGERDLNWQIVTLAAPIDDLHDAPILYISGNEALALPADARTKLKLFVEQGGLILGNADCGGRAFVDSFRKLGKELFPAYEFRELPESHPIYTSQQFQRAKWKKPPSMLGISNGVRELMLLVPAADPAKSWQLELVGGRDEMWQLAADIFLYAVDKQNARTRGQTYLIERFEGSKANTTIKVARLQYAGNWDPEPGGWRRLGNLLHNREKLDLEIVSVKLDALGDASVIGRARVAHLTGTTPIKFNDATRAQLKLFVESGGTLLIDAAGGAGEFAQSVQGELAAMFPGKSPETLPPDHPIFSAGGFKMKPVTYRPFAVRTLGEAKETPRLQAIDLNGRAAVIFSAEDLSAGMVGQAVDGIVGYSPESATELVARILLYAAPAKEAR